MPRPSKKKKQSATSKPTRSTADEPSVAVRRRLPSLMALKFWQRQKTDKPAHIAMPGVIAFSVEVLKFLRTHVALFARLALLAWVVLILVVGISQQAQYQSLREAAEAYSSELAAPGAQTPLEIGTLVLGVLGGTQNTALSEMQQLWMGVVYFFLWLVMVWLLRHLLAGASVTVRDGLYNAGAPLISTLLVAVVGFVQLLPLAIGMAIFSVAVSSGIIQGAVLPIFFSFLLLLLTVVTFYWLITTIFGAIVVTIPGTYPRAALRSAKQLIAGQRVRMLGRLLWVVFICLLVFAIFAIPVVTLDHLLGTTDTLLVAGLLQFATVVLSIYASTYVYLLYRKIVDERG